MPNDILQSNVGTFTVGTLLHLARVNTPSLLKDTQKDIYDRHDPETYRTVGQYFLY